MSGKSYYDLPSIRTASLGRISTNQSFNAIKESTSWLAKINDKEYSLNMEKYRAEQKQIKATIKKVEEINKTAPALELALIPNDEKKLSADNDKLERRKQWIKNLSKDIYLGESVNVMNDMIREICTGEEIIIAFEQYKMVNVKKCLITLTICFLQVSFPEYIKVMANMTDNHVTNRVNCNLFII